MKKRNIFWGVFLVLMAVVVVAWQFTGFATLGFWSVLALVLVAAMLIESLISLNLGLSVFSLALGYLILQKPLGLPYINGWLLLLAAALAGIGLSILVRPGRRRWKKEYHANIGHSSGNYISGGSLERNSDDNHPEISVSFNSTTCYLHSAALETGAFKASFGQLEVYFTDAKIAPQGADIYLDSSFGNIVLYVPFGWRVEDNVSVSLGNFTNNTRMAVDSGAPALRISGSVSLGNAEVNAV